MRPPVPLPVAFDATTIGNIFSVSKSTIGGEVPTDTFRMATFIKLLKRGASTKLAGQGAVAIHFLHDDLVPSSRQFEKACRKLSKATAKATKKTPVEDLGPLFVSALGELRGLAEAAGEMGYVAQADLTD